MVRGSWNPWLGQVALAGSRRARLGDARGLNDENFYEALDFPAAVVDFWSPSCLPCMKYKPVFEGVAAQPPGDVYMATVNADESPETMTKYGIDSIPTTLFFVNGEEVNRTQGILQKQDLLAAIAKAFPAQTSPGTSDQVSPTSEPGTTRVPVKPGPVGPRPAQQAAASAPSTAPTTPTTPKAAPAASSPGLSKTTLLVGGVAVVAVTAMIILFSGD